MTIIWNYSLVFQVSTVTRTATKATSKTYLCRANCNRPQPFSRIYRDRALNFTWPTTHRQEEFRRFIKPKFLLSAKPRQVRSRCKMLRGSTWCRHQSVWPTSKCIRAFIRMPRKDRYISCEIFSKWEIFTTSNATKMRRKITSKEIKRNFDIKDWDLLNILCALRKREKM